MLRAGAAFQSRGGQKRSKMLMAWCVARVADASIEAHSYTVKQPHGAFSLQVEGGRLTLRRLRPVYGNCPK
jgi:hypothetical protein